MEMESKLKIAVIGIGNAGCQAAQQAYQKGHSVFCINSSGRDLDDQVLDKTIPAFLIGNKRGAGKNRSNAKEFMKFEIKRLFGETPAFNDIVKESDVVVVVASTGGGTGSGVAPTLAKALMKVFPNKVVIFFGILPKYSESSQAQFNTVECLNEIVEDPKYKPAYMLADLHCYEDEPMDQAYEKMSKYVADVINVIRGDYLTQTPYGMIDENDMLTMLASEGYMIISHVDSITKADIEAHSSQSIMIDMLKNAPVAPRQKDKVIRNMGIIMNTVDQADDPCKSGNFSELEEYTGHPLATFVNYSVDNKQRSEFSLILSGMHNPVDRIAECTELAKRCEAIFDSNKSGSSIKDELSDLGKISELRSDTKDSTHDRILGVSSAENENVDFEDLF